MECLVQAEQFSLSHLVGAGGHVSQRHNDVKVKAGCWYNSVPFLLSHKPPLSNVQSLTSTVVIMWEKVLLVATVGCHSKRYWKLEHC